MHQHDNTGSIKYVHVTCLDQWRKTTQNKNNYFQVLDLHVHACTKQHTPQRMFLHTFLILLSLSPLAFPLLLLHHSLSHSFFFLFCPVWELPLQVQLQARISLPATRFHCCSSRHYSHHSPLTHRAVWLCMEAFRIFFRVCFFCFGCFFLLCPFTGLSFFSPAHLFVFFGHILWHLPFLLRKKKHPLTTPLPLMQSNATTEKRKTVRGVLSSGLICFTSCLALSLWAFSDFSNYFSWYVLRKFAWTN